MNNQEANKRFFVLDIVRGLAVFLMVAAHSVFFFHNGTNPVLLGVEKLGNTLAFTAFLIVSGASTYIAYLKNKDLIEIKRKRLFNRALVLLFSYYTLAIIIESKSIISSEGFEGFKQIFKILTFDTIPSYTQFIPPFIFFSLLVYFLPKFFYSIATSVPKALFFSAYIYITGVAIGYLDVPAFLQPLKLNLVGAAGAYRFPLLYYAPIFILGAAWGCWLTCKQHQKNKEEISKFLSVISFVGIISIIIMLLTSGRNLDVFFLRWPPSIPFLLTGIFFTFASATILYKLKLLKRFPLLRDTFLLLGQNAYGVFWSHTLLISIYGLAGASKIGSTTIFLTLSLFMLIIAVALATFIPFNFKFALTFHNKDHDEEDAILHSEPIYRMGDEFHTEASADIRKLKNFFFPKHTGAEAQEKLIKKRHFLAGTIITILISLITLPSFSEEAQKIFTPNNEPNWYKDDFTYRSNLTIENEESFSNIPKSSVLKVSINHRLLVEQEKSLPDGDDFQIAYWDGKEYLDVELYSNNWNQKDTNIYFFTPIKISESQKEEKFYAYYGNGLAKKDQGKKTFKEWEYKYSINIGDEETHDPIIKVGKIWNLKLQEKEELEVLVIFEKDKSYKEVSAEILDTNIKKELTEKDVGSWSTKLDIKSLKPGKYQVQAELKNDNGKSKTQKAYFYVSYPLYITWTIDWEGFEASNSYLNNMAQIADTNGLPMTHLFNPRIYVTSQVTKERAKFFTDWVLARKNNNGEDIGMHLHWYDDFVQSAGVELKKQFSWGNTGLGLGYETLPSNFTEEELIKMINYGKSLFKANGLPEPISYRAGGWFANLDLLNALEETNFKVDTSGRVKYNFGPNKVESYWNLLETQAPYHPSKTNQNRQLESNLNLWEIPNNGADSYWFSAQDMISRFDKNYSGGILYSPVQVTFLSHPNWFDNKEKQKVETLFSYTNKYINTKDSGPVKYVTLSTMYQDWLNKE